MASALPLSKPTLSPQTLELIKGLGAPAATPSGGAASASLPPDGGLPPTTAPKVGRFSPDTMKALDDLFVGAPAKGRAPADDASIGGELVSGMRRGVIGSAGAVARVFGGEEAAKGLTEKALETPAAVESYTDITGVESALEYVSGGIGGSIPEMAAVAGVAGVAAVAGAPVLAVGALAIGASALFNTGRNILRQEAENPEEEPSYVTAVGAGIAQGLLDRIVPGKAGQAIGTAVRARVTGAVQEAVAKGAGSFIKRVGTDAAIESTTEGIQQGIEILQADPDLLRVLVNPETDDEIVRSDELMTELVDSALLGGAAGGAFSGAAAGVERLARGRGPGEPPAPAGGLPAAPVAPVGSVSGNYYARLAQRESGGNAAAQAPGSSAGGLYQFTNDTWLKAIRKYRPDLAEGISDKALLAMKVSADLQQDVIEPFTEENAEGLRNAGLPVNDVTAYAAHHFGVGGATALLTADPSKPVADVLGAKVVKANPYLQGKTVAETIANLEASFGPGAPVVEMPEIAHVQTIEDKSGEPLRDAAPVRQKKVLKEAFDQAFRDVVAQQMPKEIRGKLDAVLMPLSGGRTTPLERMVSIARGEALIENMTLAESRTVGQETLRRFGYGLEAATNLKSPSELIKPKFGTKPIDMASASMARVIESQFNRSDQSAFVRSDYARSLFPRALDLMANVADRIVQKHSFDVANFKGKKDKPRNFAKTSGIVRASADLRAFSDALQQLSAGKEVPNHTAIVSRGLSALTHVNPDLRTLVDRVLRGYTPPTALAGFRAKDETPKLMHDVMGHIIKLAQTPKLQYDYSKLIGAAKRPKRARLYTDVVSRSLNTRQVLAEKSAADAIKALQKETRNLREERETILQREEREEIERSRKAASEQSMADLTKYLATTPGPGGAGTGTSNVVGPFQQPPRAPSWAQQRMPLGLMQTRQISQSFGRFLMKVRYGRAVVDFVEAMRRAWQAGDAEGRALMSAGDNLAVELNRNLTPVEMTGLGTVMDNATTYQMHMMNANGAMFATQDDFEKSLEPADDDNKIPAGINAHIPEEQRSEVIGFWNDFDRMSPKQKDYYRKVRDYYYGVNKRTLDDAIRLLAIKLLGYNSKINNAADAQRAIDASMGPKPGPNALSDESIDAFRTLLGVSRVKGDYFRMDRDDGDFYVYATQDHIFDGATRDEAKAKLDAAMKANPRMQPKAGTETFVEEGNRVTITGTVSYYKQFQTKRSADRAKEKLEAAKSGGIDGFTPTFVSNTSRRSKKLWAHDMPPAAIATLERLAKSFEVKDDKRASPALADAIRTFAVNRNRSMVTIKRDNVLGATNNISANLRAFAVRKGLHLREMHSHPEVTRIREEIETNLRTGLQATEGYGPAGIETRRVLEHMDKLDKQRQDAFNEGFMRSLSRIGTSTAVIWFLSSLSYYALNLAQPVIYGVPFMYSKYGAAGVKELLLANARLMRLAGKGAVTMPATMIGRSPVDYYKEIDLRDPKDPSMSLGARETATFDPLTGEPIYLHNTRSEYDEFNNGLISFDRLRYLSESRKLGAFGASFYEAPEMLTQAHDPDAAVTAMEKATGAAARSAKGTLGYLTKVVSHMAEHIEYVNRRSVADAVYNMEMAKLQKAQADPTMKIPSLSDNDVVRIAGLADALNTQVNVDYSSGNRALIQQKAGPLLLFSSFGWHFMYQSWQAFNAMTRGVTDQGFTRKEGTLAFLSLVGGHMMVSGLAAGVPQWMMLPGSAAMWGMETLVAEIFGIGDDDDEEMKKLADLGFWNYAKGWTRDNFGDTWADVLFEGLSSAVLDADLQNRVTLSEGYSFTDFGKIANSEDDLMATAFDLLGPVPGMLRSILRGKEKIGEQGLSAQLLIESFSPIKMTRDVAKAYSLGTMGMRDRSGKVLLDPEQLNAVDLLVQAIGFTPTPVADVFRRRDLDYALKGPVQTERDNIFTRYRRSETSDERHEVDKLRREFNAKYPDFAITMDGLKNSRQSTSETEREFRRTGGVSMENPDIARTVGAIEGKP